MMIKASDERFCLVRVCLSHCAVIYAARRDLHGEQHRRFPRRALSLNARPVPIGARFRNCCSVMIRTRQSGK